MLSLDALRQRQNAHHFADNILKLILLYAKCYILIQVSLKFLPNDPTTDSLGSDDDLAPNRWQAISWTNGGLVYWCIYTFHPASMS